MAAPDQHRVTSAILRIESAKLIAMLARRVRSLELAEEIAQDVFVEALASWERSGARDSPGAWLMTAAKHRALDALRNSRRAERKHEQLEHETRRAVPAD